MPVINLLTSMILFVFPYILVHLMMRVNMAVMVIVKICFVVMVVEMLWKQMMFKIMSGHHRCACIMHVLAKFCTVLELLLQGKKAPTSCSTSSAVTTALSKRV